MEPETRATEDGVTRTSPGPDAGPAPPPDFAVAAAGTRIGPYEVLRELGQGGMGRVYLARDTRLERTVALKVMAAGLAGRADHRLRFLREARTAGTLDHPNVVLVYEADETLDPSGQALPYIAMEFVEGTDLSRLLGTVPLREIVELLRQTADALAHAHGKGLVHRDVKPANILVSTSSLQPPASSLFTAKLTDFGLAREVEEGAERVTRTGDVLGTPHYMAPEQWLGDAGRITAASDQYALGCVLYEALCGAPPFAKVDLRALGATVLMKDPDPPRKINPRVHQDLETVCLKAIGKDPARRYPDCEALAEDLRRFLAGEPILARPAGRLERAAKWAKRNRALAGALGLAAAALLVLAGVLARGEWARREAVSERAEEIRALLEKAARYEEFKENVGALGIYQQVVGMDPFNGAAQARIRELEKAVREADLRQREGMIAVNLGLAITASRESGLKARAMLDLRASVEDARRLADAQPAAAIDTPAKANFYKLRDDLREVAAAREAAFKDAVRAYGEVLALASRHPKANQELAELYFGRFREEEDGGRADEARPYSALARQYAAVAGEACKGILEYLDAPGTVTLDTAPSGAEVWLFRYEERGPLLVPRPAGADGAVLKDAQPVPSDPARALSELVLSPANRLGATPFQNMKLASGSYLFLISKPGYRDLRYPVYLERGTAWEGKTVPLYTDEQIGRGWVYVPPGWSWIGAPDEAARDQAVPERRVWVDGLLMAQSELTLLEYLGFLMDADSQQADGLRWPEFLDAQSRLRRVPRRESHATPYVFLRVVDGVIEWGSERYRAEWPVLAVSAQDADAYVRWRNGKEGRGAGRPAPGEPRTWLCRLPAGKEWQRAARGADRRPYPWGTTFDPSMCKNSYHMPSDRPFPDGRAPTDLSPFGVLDLVGSVQEWSGDLWNADNLDHEIRTYRGGAYLFGSEDVFHVTHFNNQSDAHVDDAVGFRLVRAPR